MSSSRAGNASPADDFANFSNINNQEATNGHHYQSYNENFDEEIDFAPQNGYSEEMSPDMQQVSYDEESLEMDGSGKKQKMKSMKSAER